MKFLYDFFPIICFFIAYKLFGVYIATAATMVASFLQVGFYWLRQRRFEKLHLITLAFVLVLGGSTLIFHDAIFIKWKPSIIYWIFCGFLLASQYFGKQPITKRLLAEKITLPNKVWKRVNLSWALFFLFLGFLNIYVVYHYNTNSWVNFKLFGTLGLTVVFIVLQTWYMSRHITPPESSKE
ncbi:MAG: septation protein A [Gammaproteobacteria bacterium]|nr:septation protein A [Gammaproteobacteria bacterium]